MRFVAIALFAILATGCMSLPPTSIEVANALHSVELERGRPDGRLQGLVTQTITTSVSFSAETYYSDGGLLQASQGVEFAGMRDPAAFCAKDRLVWWPKGMESHPSYETPNDAGTCAPLLGRGTIPEQDLISQAWNRLVNATPELRDALATTNRPTDAPVGTLSQKLDPFRAKAEEVRDVRASGSGWTAIVHQGNDESWSDFKVTASRGNVTRLEFIYPAGIHMTTTTYLTWGPRDQSPDFRGQTSV